MPYVLIQTETADIDITPADGVAAVRTLAAGALEDILWGLINAEYEAKKVAEAAKRVERDIMAAVGCEDDPDNYECD